MFNPGTAWAAVIAPHAFTKFFIKVKAHAKNNYQKG